METILASVQGVIGAVLTGVVALVGKYAVAFLSEQTQKVKEQGRRELFETTLTQADKLTDTIVKKLENTTVKSLKERSSDGKLSRSDIFAIQKESADMLKSFVDIDLKEALDWVMGDSEKYLKSLIEAKVYELSQKSKENPPIIMADDYIPSKDELEATIQ